MMEMLHQPARNEHDPIVETYPSPSARQLLASLKAVVLMAGSVRASKMDASIGRSLMQLPINSDRSLIDCWQMHLTNLAKSLDCEKLNALVMIDKTSTPPSLPPNNEAITFHCTRDPQDYRGTGGVLSDLAAAYRDDDYLLVANGIQLLLEPLEELTVKLAAHGGDVSLVGHQDGTPSGMMLVRCGVLRNVPRAGFVDMKEQALPAIAREHTVRVVELAQPSALPVRTLSDYMHALRVHHRRFKHNLAVQDPFAEDLQSSYAVVEDPADVAESARIHDSVVLAGARIHPEAILVRSLVCPGAIVGRGQRVVDRVVAGPAAVRKREASWS